MTNRSAPITHATCTWGAVVRHGVPWLVLSASLAGCAGVSMRPENTRSIESVAPEIARQFSACDLDALMANYSVTVEFVSPSTPKPIVGRTALREHLSGACQGPVRPVMRIEAQRVQRLSSEAAVVTGAYTFGRSDAPNDKPWTAFFVITLSQRDGRWQVNTQATFAVPEG